MKIWKFIAAVLVPGVAALFAMSAYVSTTRAYASEQYWTQDGLRLHLSDQRSATKVQLLVAVESMYNTSITNDSLPVVSCIYETTSSSAIEALVDEISASVSPREEIGIGREPTIGISFYKGDKVRGDNVSAKLYFGRGRFPDGKKETRGVFDERYAGLKADFEFRDRLQRWAQRSDVTRTKLPTAFKIQPDESPETVCREPPKPARN